MARDLAGPGRGLGDVADDLLGRRVLLLHLSRDRGGHAADHADAAGDGRDHRTGRIAHRPDLAGEGLRLGGDDREAPSRRARDAGQSVSGRSRW